MRLCWWRCVEDVVVVRLLRKTSLRCSKCCACHAKRGSAHSQFASLVAELPRTSMKVLQVLHLPRKTNLTCSKCCACQLVKVIQVLHLPCKTSLRCSKYCTCHAKRAGGAPSAAPATQSEPEVLQVLRLPRKNEPWWWWVDGVVLMVLCWWCCVDGVVLMVLCWWCCVEGVVLMVMCRWCSALMVLWWGVVVYVLMVLWRVDGVVWMGMCWWCCVDGCDVLMVCVDGVVVMCWWCVLMVLWWCVDGVVLMVLCWWCCVDGVLLMVLFWWCCVDGVVVMVLCWWCCVVRRRRREEEEEEEAAGCSKKNKNPTWQCGEQEKSGYEAVFEDLSTDPPKKRNTSLRHHRTVHCRKKMKLIFQQTDSIRVHFTSKLPPGKQTVPLENDHLVRWFIH